LLASNTRSPTCSSRSSTRRRPVDDRARQRREHVAHRRPAEVLPRARDQRAKHHGGGASVVERRMRGRDVERELLDKPRQPRCLALRKVQHESRERGRVDDRVLERALQPSADEPRVERVVAVLHQHSAVCEAQEGAAGIAKLRSANQHRAVDVVAPVCVRVDRRLAVDQRVKEGERAGELEALRADLQDQERRIARALDIERDELRLVEAGLRA
jgi:hypothetical protein